MKILVVDDDPTFRATYELILEEEGFEVTAIPGRAEAEAALRDQSWDVVILDQNLLGEAGGPIGLELVETIRGYAPAAQIIVVSGYAEEQAIKRAFALGVDDYLVKTHLLRELLLAKLRIAERALTEIRLARLEAPELRARLEATWRKLQTATDRAEKGRLLEDLLTFMLSSIEGFGRVIPRLSNDEEELDVVAVIDSPQWGFLQSPYVLVECKNWSKPVGRHELDALVGKMLRRKQRCTVGLFVAWSGFTAPFKKAAEIVNELTVVMLDRADLEAFIASPNPAEVFKGWIHRAVLGTDVSG